MTKGGTKKHLVYHYCSLESFMAIIQSKAIHLTDINKTNDYMEKKWIARYIFNTIDEQLEKNNVMMDLDEEYCYNDDTATHRAFLVDYVDKLMCNADPILVACFSSNGDLLSQWRAYANDGKGVAIGFDAYFRGEFEEFCEVLTRNMSFTSCFYKNPAFQEELESRIVYDLEIMIDIFDPNDAPFPCFENSRKIGKFLSRRFDTISAMIRSCRIRTCLLKNC